MSNATKFVSIRDAKGKYGRMEFATLLHPPEWAQLKPHAIVELGRDVVGLIEDLPKHNGHIGWWNPRAFQDKPCETELDASVACSPEGFGWLTALSLRKHEAQVLGFLEHHWNNSKIGRSRKESQEYNEQRRRDRQAVEDIKPFTPFVGAASIKRMLAPGSSIEVEQPKQFLQADAFVIYSQHFDAYMTQQGMWKGLNRARQFVSQDEALGYIESARLKDCMTAQISMRVQAFSLPQKLGPKAQAALTFRNAEELEENTPLPPGTTPPRRRI